MLRLDRKKKIAIGAVYSLERERDAQKTVSDAKVNFIQGVTF